MCSDVEGGFCLLDALAVLEMPEVIRRALLWRLWRVGFVRWRYCEVLEMPKVIRCLLVCMLHVVKGRLCSLEML